MSKEKLLSIEPKSAHARRAQQLMLEYHEYRQSKQDHPLSHTIERLGVWQINRLKSTHQSYYSDPRYQDALDFLLEDLYTPKQFLRRDADLERIFPKMVKLIPEQALGIVADLVELNLLTQKLDEHLATKLVELGCEETWSDTQYAEAFRLCDNIHSRQHQLHLIDSIGHQLEKYVSSRILNLSLTITQKPAEMAGLGQLHRFIQRGFSSFRTMKDVSELLKPVLAREAEMIEAFFAGRFDYLSQ